MTDAAANALLKLAATMAHPVAVMVLCPSTFTATHPRSKKRFSRPSLIFALRDFSQRLLRRAAGPQPTSSFRSVCQTRSRWCLNCAEITTDSLITDVERHARCAWRA